MAAVDWNPWAWTILLVVLGRWALEVAADLLELRALRPEPPADVADVYAPEEYRRSQAYARARLRFGLLPATVELAALLAVWLSGALGALEAAARGLGLGTVGTGLVVLGVLMAGQTLVVLPFRWWRTFRIEERFGFNRQTQRVFWTDRLKALGLALVLGLPLLAAVLWLLDRAGPTAWLWCWLVAGSVVLLVQLVAPAWILPLFHRFRPLEDGELRERILAYAERVGFPVAGLYVIDGSRRTTKANAFFTGFGRNRRIALFDTLLERHDADEVVAVVAHEIGHWRRGHVPKGVALALLHLGLLFLLLQVVLDLAGPARALGFVGPSPHAALVAFTLLYTPLETLLQVGMQALSRRHEYEADRFAVETTGSWRPLAEGLKKLSAHSLSNLTPHPLHVALHHGHPPLRDRLRALRGT